ncbi:glycerophosphodiester phosphodiesterase [Myceligenerans xiligouense]|uniref:Glycerophosphoryl diester phosphodiesterase n=1 Tax=Myceligenerans xiligouense TaxID=253184 RepID=A0A3N4YQ69_9MICO|nr:glycerophosphodiester phosphodiesterase family protein [Myceligenerans xiligouense]RPF23189.1 glycerophosphoryl diester phosphodiesterase [Myceligenerans xiligouense]
MALLERSAGLVRPVAVGSTAVSRPASPSGTAVGPTAAHRAADHRGRPAERVTTGRIPLRRPAARKRVPRWTPLVWLALLADHRRHARLAARSAAVSGAGAALAPRTGPRPPGTVPVTTGTTGDPAGPPGTLGRVTRPAVVAHRGNSSVAPQNTLASIEAACRAGADAVEIDLRRTADGAAVVIHDDVVDETTDGHGAVADLSLDQLRALDAGRWFGPAYAGQRIPLLAEVLEILGRYPNTRLLLELKDVWEPAEVHGVTTTIDDAGLGERVLVQCFWPDTVAAVREVAPHLERGLLLAYEPPDVLDVCAGLGVVACNPSAEMVRRDPGIVTRLHRAGLRVMVWTENDPSGWSHLCEVDDGAGVDAIITDRPDRLLGWFSR